MRQRGVGAWVPDATTFLTLFLALQFLIPARLVVSGLGGAGRPSNLIGLGLLVLVLGAALQSKPPGAVRLRQPIRWVIGFFAVVQLVTYAAGVDRGLPGAEMRSSDRWLLLVFGLVGVALAVCDGVPRSRLDVLLRRLTYLAGAMASVGLVQALTGFNPAEYVSLPGLTMNRDVIGISSRGGIPRVAGTAAHYIELGVVCAMVFPVAVHFVLFARSTRQRVAAVSVSVLLLGGIAFSLSRSAILSLLVAVVVLALGWPLRWRVQALVMSTLLVLGIAVTSGTWLQTMVELFTGAEDDPSVQSRLVDYPLALAYVAERPWFGRGPATFLPDEYILLDNEYLITLVTGGVVGVVGLVVLLAAPILVAVRIRRRADGAEDAHLAQALAAGLAVALLSSATYDAFAFTTFAGVTFMLVGSLGSLYRAVHSTPRPATAATPHSRLGDTA